MTKDNHPTILPIPVAIIQDKEKRFLLVFKETAMSQACTAHWQLPGGTMEYGDNVKDAVVKKLKDYLNLTIEALHIYSFVPSVVSRDQDKAYEFVVIPIQCQITSGHIKVKKGKIREARYFSFEELRTLHQQGLLVDKDLEIIQYVLNKESI